MKFETPAALWGLCSLLLLVLFSLWRQAAARAVVPSLLLWKRIPERNPPVRALRRPKWRVELLLQALAIAAAVAALAGPYRESPEKKPRRVALVIDTSARLAAGDRHARLREEAKRLQATSLEKDEVAIYAGSPAPRRLKSVDEAAPAGEHVELEPVLAAARAGSDHVIVFSDRAAEGANAFLAAAPADNAGIVEFSPGEDEVFIRIVDHGPSRAIPVELTAGAIKVRETIPAGGLRWSHKGDFSKADSVRVAIDVADSFPADNIVEAVRLADPATTISVSGLLPPQLLKALRSIPGATVRTGQGKATLAIGVNDEPGPGDFRVWIVPASTRIQKPVTVGKHPVLAELEKFTGELSGVLGELPPPDRAGEPLMTIDGKVAAAIRGRELRICADVTEWGKGLPSLPIFCANLADVAHGGASRFVVLKTGRPLLLPPGTSLTGVPAGPDGTVVVHTLGEYGLQTPAGARTLRAALLDERESDTAGGSRALSWSGGASPGDEPRRTPYGGAAAGAALAFLLVAWIMQLRNE